MALFRRSVAILRRCVAQTIYSTPVKDQARTIHRWVAPTLRELEKRRRKVGPQTPHPRTSYLEWNYDAEIFAFAKRLGEEFDNGLLRQAFIHRSYVIQQEIKEDTNETDLQDNRELINEGNLFITSHIRRKYQDLYASEAVEAIVTHLTSEAMLSHVASHMGVKDLILSSDDPVEKSTLANTFRAVVGALKLSTDDMKTSKFVDDFLICQLNGKDLFELWELKNPFEYLLRILKDKGYAEVEPRLCNQSAMNTILANYQIGLYSSKKLLGIGWGESIEVAKDSAALDAIQKLQKGQPDLS